MEWRTIRENGFLEAKDGTRYCNLTIYYDTWMHSVGLFVSGRLKDKLLTLNGIADDTIKPKKGSSIYVAPKCPVATEDIRKNYTIKRAPDTGGYNVFYPLNDYAVYGYTVSSTLIIPKHNIAFLCRDAVTQYILMAEARTFFPDLQDSDCIYNYGQYSIYCFDAPQCYVDLLAGKYKKPIVSIKNLDLDTENELNIDVLEIVLRAAQADYTAKSLETLSMQLKVLNQYNWRQYPGTVSLLMNDILCGCRLVGYLRHCPSKNSKPVNEILKTRSGFKDEKDMLLSQQFVNHLMNVGENRFVGTGVLIDKLNEFGIGLDVFSKLFNTITRITPKEFKNEEKEN